ncbi:MAG: SdpI family protein [Candidatus Buchananbacteria bacterium]
MTNPLKISLKSEAIPAILILLSIAASFYFYANFPQTVATHWNYRGEIDGWSSKAFAAFFFPALSIGIYLLFLALPYFDPKKDRYAEFAKPYHIFKNLFVIFMTAIYFLVGFAGLGYNISIDVVVPASVGALFIIMGNYLGKIKSNWFMGIRTPWTLSNEIVWDKTNRLGGKLFILTGILMLLGVFLPNEIFWLLFIITMVIVVIVPIVYSFLLFKKLEKKS